MENNKNNTLAWVIGIIAVVLIVGGFYASYRTKHSGGTGSDTVASISPSPEMTLSRLDVKHQYKNGVHTYAADIELPTPCESLTSALSVDATNTKKLNLTLTAKATGEMCAQVVTTRAFKASVAGDKAATASATFNGQPLILNVFEVPATQDLDSFKIDIKS